MVKRNYIIIGALFLSLLFCSSAFAPLTVTKDRSGKPVFHLPPPTAYQSQRNQPTEVTPPLLLHSPVRMALGGKPLTISVTVKNPQQGMEIILHYRLSDGGAYFSLPLQGNPEEGFETLIPKYMVDSQGLEYYIEAVNKRGQIVASSGSQDTPHLVQVKAQKARVSPLLWGLVILAVLAIPFTFRRKKR